MYTFDQSVFIATKLEWELKVENIRKLSFPYTVVKENANVKQMFDIHCQLGNSLGIYIERMEFPSQLMNVYVENAFKYCKLVMDLNKECEESGKRICKEIKDAQDKRKLEARLLEEEAAKKRKDDEAERERKENEMKEYALKVVEEMRLAAISKGFQVE